MARPTATSDPALRRGPVTSEKPVRKRRLDSRVTSAKKPKITEAPAKPLSDSRSAELAAEFVDHDVASIYKVIHKTTGALGGNAAGGAIYGEITRNSMGKILEYMQKNCELGRDSVFLDIGSGLGKPNFHASMTPGVAVSYGIELEDQRWQLSLSNLQGVLKTSTLYPKVNPVIFTQGDITDALSLEPFSHVYSFDVGFPPAVMAHVAECFNESASARYFISFHQPRKVLEQYGFEVDEIGRLGTSMAGSSEGHTVYFYRKTALSTRTKETKEKKVDPLFGTGFHVVQQGHDAVLSWVEAQFAQRFSQGRTRRQVQLAKAATPSSLREKKLETFYKVVRRGPVSVKAK
ncbi:hypothetical protein SPRG_07650 [Saprolegnia parasitica CBS 223.65]|uniref:DOT1 domain-containing protein n=1 Tax=Saprolegnia parasitica (strain CBS 223.65) TaxID=695850 RepID=A0A067CJE8_SAPPC|nr:hypothetical protein SPRG_07650 [Saprolegnia parasitica CBS 223.65]KDO26937.1 hypothetical protein SPRG_07650 [Saprolegnia parasitica CBS 223.65]|eukprot:XP_012202318.1 hypothetical protein SPRG_07650 [Saprolegnia parasitica CBS 223.65]